MYNEFMVDTKRLWYVSFTTKDMYGHFRSNYGKNVSAITAEEAITRLRVDYPECKILSVSHKGSIDLE